MSTTDDLSNSAQTQLPEQDNPENENITVIKAQATGTNATTQVEVELQTWWINKITKRIK